MRMRPLEVGGIPVLADGIRAADVDNPHGYYEFERVKELKEDKTWLGEARGRVVKMVCAGRGPARARLGDRAVVAGAGPPRANGSHCCALLGANGRERSDQVPRALGPAFTEVDRTLSRNGVLPPMITHGSLGVSAVLFDGPSLTGVLDYERAAQEIRALDLAYTLRALARRPKDEPGAFDLPRVALFMSAYQKIEPLAPGEAGQLPGVMRAQRLLKVAGKSSNFLAKDAVVAEQPKDADKLIETLEQELPRLRWLEKHESDMRAAVADTGPR